MERFLITTALEETWLDDRPVLFLGEWCRLYSRKERWSKMNAVVLPDHWEDRDKFFADYQYLRDFYERTLGNLASRLNQIHGVDHNLRYWRILIGPWLAYFVQALFDRWSSIQEALNRFQIAGTIILAGDEGELVPNDMNHMVEIMLGDKWNHHMYGSIFERLGNAPFSRSSSKCQVVVPKAGRVGIKQRIATLYSAVASRFVMDRDVFLIETNLNFSGEAGLNLRFSQVPQRWKRCSPVHVPVELQQRAWEMTEQGQSAFESFVFSMIPTQIPRLYLEGYRQLIEQTSRLPWPNHPKVIYAANALWHDTVTMAYTAEKVEQGTPLVYGQHGGFYGIGRFAWTEEHERKIADRYLTWGWTEGGEAETLPVGITKKIRFRVASTSRVATDLLLVLCTVPRYTFRLDSDAGASRTKKRISDCLQFGHSLLGTGPYRALLVRPHVVEYGWGEKEHWRETHPTVRLDDGITPIWDLVEGSRLVVYTYNSSGYLEFFAANVPTIIFWDISSMPVRNSAIPYFDDLRRVGIFHDTPESAAAHVNMIWNDVSAWWASADVRRVLARFKKQYCYCPNNLIDHLETALRDVISESEVRKTSVDTIS